MDEYSDDGFDDLNPNVLDELENNAIQFTQAQPPTQKPQSNGASFELELEDDDLDDTEVVNDLLGPKATAAVLANNARAPGPAAPPPPAPAPGHRPPQQLERQWNAQPNPYRNVPSRTPYPLPVPPRGLHPPSQHVPSSQAGPFRPQASQFGRPPPPPPPRHGGFHHNFQASQGPPAHPPQSGAANDMVAALQQRVKSLQSELYSAKGEVTIIRSNSTKAQHEHAAEVSRLRKQNAEEQAKNQRLLEAAVTKEKSATTELQFLQRDMQEASTRAKRRDTSSKSSKTAGNDAGKGIVTPRKANKTWVVGDGFEDMDIVLSPSKGRSKGRDAGSVAGNVGERTPTRNKRKRPAVESPVMPLDIEEGDVVMPDEDSQIPPPAPSTVVPSPLQTALPFEFLQLVLDHGTVYGEPPTFDIFSRYFFPSDPSTSFAALIFQKLPILGNPHNPRQLLVDFSRLILVLWDQCIEEQFLRPIWDLASLLAFTLQLDTKSVAPYVINEFIPAAEKSIYMVAECRFKSPNGGNLSADPTADALQRQVDSTYILSLLSLVAMASTTSVTQTDAGTETRQSEFWRMVPLDLVLILLTQNQLLDDILGILDLLCTSVLPGSVGPLVATREPQAVAYMVIEKITWNLVEMPKAAVTPRQRHAVGLGVVRTLAAFSRSPFGAVELAKHVHAIPRLVTALSALVDELYDTVDTAPTAGDHDSGNVDDKDDDSPSDQDDLEGAHRLIKEKVLLLHNLVTGPRTSDVVKIQSKLATAYGGPQRYILALSRIHFAEEDLVYEARIDEETADLARELCEFVVTPDEGEGVREAFDG